MSKSAYLFLSGAVVFTTSVVYYVHKSQKDDLIRLREGVINDLERQQRKSQNIQQLAMQADLTKFLKEQQQENDLRSELTNQTSG